MKEEKYAGLQYKIRKNGGYYLTLVRKDETLLIINLI